MTPEGKEFLFRYQRRPEIGDRLVRGGYVVERIEGDRFYVRLHPDFPQQV